MKTTIRGAFLVEFQKEGGEILPEKLVWGIIVQDETGRWQPGNYVCTSVIKQIEELADGITRFITRRSVYEALGEVTPYTLPLEDFPNLRMGYSPEELQMIREGGLKLVKEEDL